MQADVLYKLRWFPKALALCRIHSIVIDKHVPRKGHFVILSSP